MRSRDFWRQSWGRSTNRADIDRAYPGHIPIKHSAVRNLSSRRAEFADGTVFTRDFNAAPRAVAASHSFTITGSGVDGTYVARAGTVGLFSNNTTFNGIFNSTANSFINGDAFPVAIAGIASQLRFDAGGTVPDAVLGEALTLSHLTAAVFGSGGLQRLSQSGSGSTNYDLVNFSSRAYEVGGPAVVPLPAASPMLLAGLGALGFVRGRSRKVPA